MYLLYTCLDNVLSGSSDGVQCVIVSYPRLQKGWGFIHSFLKAISPISVELFWLTMWRRKADSNQIVSRSHSSFATSMAKLSLKICLEKWMFNTSRLSSLSCSVRTGFYLKISALSLWKYKTEPRSSGAGIHSSLRSEIQRCFCFKDQNTKYLIRSWRNLIEQRTMNRFVIF